MILQLMKRDAAWKYTPALTLGAALAAWTVSLAGHASSYLAGLSLPIYLVLFMRVMPHQRATFFEAALPVAARDLFAARFLAIESMVWFPALAATITLALRGYQARTVAAPPAVAMFLTVAVLAILSVRVTQFASSPWLTMTCPVLVAVAAVPALEFSNTLLLTAGSLAVACAIGAYAWRSIPPAFQSAPEKAVQERRKQGTAAPVTPWWPVLRSLFPWQSLLFIPISVVWAASNDWLFAPLYLMIAYSQTRVTLRWTQALPLSRRALVLAATVPSLIVLACGAEVGLLTGSALGKGDLVRMGDPQHVRATGTLDVDVNHAFWKLAPGGRIPVIEAPWGEKFQPPALRVPGLTFYNPYATAQSSSYEFGDWQFARATRDVYGRAMTPRELAERKYGKLRAATQTPRMQILTVAAFVAMALGWAWVLELLSWYPLMLIPAWARTALSTAAVLVPVGGVLLLDLLAGTGFRSVSGPALQWVLLAISRALPDSLFAVAGVACLFIAALFWLLGRQAESAELPQKVEENQTLFARLGSRS